MAFSFKKYRLPQVLTEPELYKMAEHYGCSTGYAKGISSLFWMVLSAVIFMSFVGAFFMTWHGIWDNGYYVLIIILIIFMGIFALSLRDFIKKQKKRKQIQADLSDGRVFLKRTKITAIKINYDAEDCDTQDIYFSDGTRWMDAPYSLHANDRKKKTEPGMICYFLCVDKNIVFVFLEHETTLSGEVQARVIDATGQNG